MNIIIKNILIKSVWLWGFFTAGILNAADDIDDYFDKTLTELAETAIASGSVRRLSQSAAIASVITAEQIKSMGATELHEVLETVPGIHASVQPLTGDYNYTVRGIQNTNNAELLILLNGTRITTPFRGTLMATTELPLEAIQQVEVIRGPGSALYGADAFAGVINIITKKAKDIDGLKAGVRAGDHNTQSGWGQYGGSWAGWDIASSLQYQHTDGDKGRILHVDTQSAFDQAYGTQASHAPGAMNTQLESFNGHLNLTRQHWDINLWVNNGESGTRSGLVGALDPKGIATAEQYLADVRFSTEDWFDNWTFMAHGSYLHGIAQIRAQSFPDNTRLPIGADGEVSYHPNGMVLFPEGYIRNLGQTEQIPTGELSALYKGLKNHLFRLTTGFRFEKTSITQQSNIGLGIIDGVRSVIDGTLTDVSNTSLAYFPKAARRTIWSAAMQDEWQLADHWQLTAGVRYDEYSDFYGTINPRAALVWDINQTMTTKWLYGKAYRMPSFVELYTQNNLVLLGNAQLQPESINSVEWAFDYHPTSTVRTAVNGYYYHIERLITLQPNVDKIAGTFQNAGHQHGYGLELEGSWQMNAQWSFKGNYAWQHALDLKADARVTGVPEHHVYAAAVYQFMPKWQLQSQLNWVGGRNAVVPYNGKLEDYQTVDFTVRGKKIWGEIDVAASLHNAFDTVSHEPNSIPTGENIPMVGRSFYLEASIHF